MNSYPLEFLAHPQPLMFVAGLLPPSASPARTRADSASRGRAGSTVARPRADSVAAPAIATASPTMPDGATMTTPLSSPMPDADAGVLLASPPVVPLHEGLAGSVLSDAPDIAAAAADLASEGQVDPKDAEFEKLVADLRGALTPMGGRSKVWLPEAKRRDFRILLVDKAVRLPIRKLTPAASPTDPAPAPHSPFSPLTPSSPLHPDGLIAPVWVRKHAELVPAVFVLFLRLYEPATVDGAAELGAEEAQERDRLERQREAEADEGLVREIADRRRRLGERGIKLTVVLMASSMMLDSPTLDARLSHLRRASALSAKASLFVLTPVPADQLPDFVQSLQDALYEAALEYYALHAKRVRRKRARVPASQLTAPPAGPPPGQPARVLAPTGWAVRYDWKAGWFAEVRGEYEVARKHYEDCWNELARMFASTSMLPPRTKRWAEAKVLADCVATRICKLLLYDGGGTNVLTPFHVHLKRFGDLSRGWGIGEETFEFWSWTARQYRIFAELLETAMTAGFPLPPSPLPTYPMSAPPPPVPIGYDYWTTPTSATQPSHVLHSPAYYYYAAACCSIERKVRFEEALEAEREDMSSEMGTAGGHLASAPGFANEKKVDHAALVIELFTKAYTLLKDQHYAQTRVALYVAFRIAETYCQAGQYELAMRFFERISQTFKRDKWAPIVREIRSMWYDCAQRTGSVETAARLLVEMMAPLTARTAFWAASAHVSAAVPFQVALSVPSTVDVSALSFSALHVAFSDDLPDLVVSAKDGDVDLVDVGTVASEAVEASASLTWQKGRVLVLSGLLEKATEGQVAVADFKLVLREAAWTLEIKLPVKPLMVWHTPRGTYTPSTPLSASTAFVQRPHDVDLRISHLSIALEGERFPITVVVENKDDRPLDVRLSIVLQTSEDDNASTIAVGEQTSHTLISLELGTLAPLSSRETVVTLVSPQSGERAIDVSLQTAAPPDPAVSAPGSPNPAAGAEEHTRSTAIVVEHPFVLDAAVRYPHAYGRAAVSAALAVAGRSVVVERLAMEAEDDSVEVLSTSIGDDFPQTWDKTALYACVANVRLGSRRPSLAPASAASVVVTWRPVPVSPGAGPAAAPTTTRLPLPPLSLPPRDAFLLAALDAPPTARLHAPFPLALRLHNTHPTDALVAAVVAETSDAYVWHGPRRVAVRVPPDHTEIIELAVTPVGGTGWAAVPAVRVFEGEDARELGVDVAQRRLLVKP
ncbi:hypothetical protein Q5752_001549 [Cryptotrichosporon argae]